MDHLLEGMRSHYDPMLCWLVVEWKSGKYKKLSECPLYNDVNTVIKSMNVIRKYLGWPILKIAEEVKEYG